MDQTREKIMCAATPLFAERGLEGVTIREICRAAAVNGALVNYHFRNKEGLYRECVERVYNATYGEKMASVVASVHDAASWRKAVKTWIETFCSIMMGNSEMCALVAGLFRNESTRPSRVQPYLDEHFARPSREHLLALMRRATANEREAQLWTTSVWFQLSTSVLLAPVWRKAHLPDGVTEADWAKTFAAFVEEQVMKGLKFRK